jgi:hypothetical protein
MFLIGQKPETFVLQRNRFVNIESKTVMKVFDWQYSKRTMLRSCITIVNLYDICPIYLDASYSQRSESRLMRNFCPDCLVLICISIDFSRSRFVWKATSPRYWLRHGDTRHISASLAIIRPTAVQPIRRTVEVWAVYVSLNLMS